MQQLNPNDVILTHHDSPRPKISLKEQTKRPAQSTLKHVIFFVTSWQMVLWICTTNSCYANVGVVEKSKE